MSSAAHGDIRTPLVNRVNAAVRRVPAWAVYVASAAWAAWLFWLAATGGLGVEPIEALEHRYGMLALQLVVVGLAVTPLRRIAGVNLQPLRRAIGVSAFGFLVAHVAVWALLDVQQVSATWADIVKRPYVTVGMAGFLLILPLAATSNDWAVRRLGGLRWRRLHWLVYPAALLGAVHFVWLSRGFQIEPLAYLGAIMVLLALRIRRMPWSTRARS